MVGGSQLRLRGIRVGPANGGQDATEPTELVDTRQKSSTHRTPRQLQLLTTLNSLKNAQQILTEAKASRVASPFASHIAMLCGFCAFLQECSADLNETKECDPGVCPVDCQPSPWRFCSFGHEGPQVQIGATKTSKLI